MLTLFSNGFSPFARKVAMALEYKGLEFETVDGLTHANRERLLAVNPRAEVPVPALEPPHSPARLIPPRIGTVHAPTWGPCTRE